LEQRDKNCLVIFADAEERLIYGYGNGKKRILSILKCLRDRQLQQEGGAVITNYHLKTLVLFEGEKHYHERFAVEDKISNAYNSLNVNSKSVYQY